MKHRSYSIYYQVGRSRVTEVRFLPQSTAPGPAGHPGLSALWVAAAATTSARARVTARRPPTPATSASASTPKKPCVTRTPVTVGPHPELKIQQPLMKRAGCGCLRNKPSCCENSLRRYGLLLGSDSLPGKAWKRFCDESGKHNNPALSRCVHILIGFYLFCPHGLTELYKYLFSTQPRVCELLEYIFGHPCF